MQVLKPISQLWPVSQACHLASDGRNSRALRTACMGRTSGGRALCALDGTSAPKCLPTSGRTTWHAAANWQTVMLSSADEGRYEKWEMFIGLLNLVNQQGVGNRPGRVEPRPLKRRRKAYSLLNKLRHVLQQEITQSWSWFLLSKCHWELTRFQSITY